MKISDLAAWSLQGRPPTIQSLILDNENFRSAIDISPSAPYPGLQSFAFGEIVAAVRRLFVEDRAQSIASKSGMKIIIKYESGRIHIEEASKVGSVLRFIPFELLLLAPDPERRLKGLDELWAEYGPTGPKTEKWRPILEERELNTLELEKIHDEIRDSFPPWQKLISNYLMSDTLTADQLIPSRPGYFIQLCGPVPKSHNVEAYLTGALHEHRRRTFFIRSPGRLIIISVWKSSQRYVSFELYLRHF